MIKKIVFVVLLFFHFISLGSAQGASNTSKPSQDQGNGDLTYNINGVSFTMKHIDGVSDAVLGELDYYENDAHRVSLSSYYMGKTEVTQKLWEAVMPVNPSYFTNSAKNPVECVSWLECIEFCNELTEAVMGDEHCVYDIKGRQVIADFDKKGFRLPTEAEWEYAAMGGTGYIYAGCNSENQLKGYAWYVENSKDRTHEVARKKSNKYGLFDMSGNVSEWCWDLYGGTDGEERIIRGGSWYNCAYRCSRVMRGSLMPDYRTNNIGFRLACR